MELKKKEDEEKKRKALEMFNNLVEKLLNDEKTITERVVNWMRGPDEEEDQNNE